ncbi:MAG: YggS family pyridoxal phosphate-dependent enzyme [Burkholderiales bacterium]|nr:YggS family pyridoxal phosphate-dependent enzyme [Burkholderiales bacterium]
MINILANLNLINQEIKLKEKDVKLIAVSKKFPYSDILIAHNHGQVAFGENYPQELAEKAQELSQYPIEWHFIGNIQSNKIKQIAKYASWVHGLSKESHAKLFNQCRENMDKLNILIEVNISNEEDKHGLHSFDEVLSLAKYIKNLQNIELKGLMGMASNTSDKNVLKTQFNRLTQIKDQLNQNGFNLIELSMGMSNDYLVAIECGATMVRIGSKIFGARNV